MNKYISHKISFFRQVNQTFFLIVLMLVVFGNTPITLFAQQKSNTPTLVDRFYFKQGPNIAKPADFTLPNKVQHGDFNADGVMDVLAYSTSQKKLGWYRQQAGLGSFDSLRVISSNLPNISEFLVTDFDGDGDDDILALQSNPGRVLLFSNLTQGTFNSAQTIFQKNDLTSFHLADVDGNGINDLIIAAQADRSVYLIKRNASFSFQESVIATNLTGVTSIRTADFTSNGKLDIAISSAASNQVLMVAQNAQGGFEVPRIVNASAFLPTFMVANDIDGDTNIDIAVYGIQSQTIYWQKNRGDATFEAPRSLATNLLGVTDFKSADLEGDGDADLVYSLASANAVFWLENLENNTFGLPQLITNNLVGVQQFTVADINKDGIRDIVTASKDDDRISWYKNFGGRRFDNRITISRRADIYNPSDVAVADINNDSFNDIVVASSENGNLIWYANSSMNVFSTLAVITDSISNYTSFTATDLNIDGREDFLISMPSKNTVEWYSPSAAGIFSASAVLTATNGVSDVVSAKIDSDENVDIVSVSPQSGLVTVHYNNGSEVFTTAISLAGFYPGVNKVAAANINTDSYIDIISASSSSSIIHVHRQAADSTFSTQPFNIPQIQGVTSLILDDLNSDGLTDLVVASAIDDKLMFLRNNGVGGFDPAVELDGNAQGVRVLASQDLDGDGDLDILSAHYDTDSIVWYENSVGIFGEPQVISDQNDGAQGLAIGDLNSDDIADLAVASGIDNKVTWYENGLAQKDGTNTAPQKLADFSDVQVTSRPTAVRTLPMTSYFTDPDGNPLRYSYSLSIDTSAVSAAFDANNRLVISIGPNYLGSFRVNVVATDGNLSASGSFLVQSVRVNNAPIATSNFQNLSFVRGWAGATQPVRLDQVFSDPDGDSLAYSLQFNANHIQAVVQNNQIVLQEVPTFLGLTGINVTATDPGGFAITRSFTITITPPNRSPIVTNELDEIIVSTTVANATIITLSQLFSDPDGNSLNYTIDYNGSLFDLTLIQNASIRLTPNSQQTGGKASFNISATDGEFTVTTTVNVWLRHPAPTIVYPTASVNVNRAVQLSWQPITAAARQEFSVIQVVGADTVDIFQDMVVDAARNTYVIPNLDYGQRYTIRLKAVDAAGNKGIEATRTFNVVGAPTTAYTKEIITPSVALNDSSFRLISLPGSYSPLPVEQFFDQSGRKGRDWVVYDYQGQDSTGIYFDEQLSFTAGKAFWHLNTDTLDVNYQAGPPSLNDNDDFVVPVVPGWNLIGSPFLTENVLWIRVQQYNQTNQPIWRFNQEWTQTSSMLPFEGYYYFSEQADSLRIPLGDRPAPSISSTKSSINQNPISAVSVTLEDLPSLEIVPASSRTEFFPIPLSRFAKRAIWLVDRDEQSGASRNVWKSSFSMPEHGLFQTEIGYRLAENESVKLDLTYLLRDNTEVSDVLIFDTKTQQITRKTAESTIKIDLSRGQSNLKIWFGSVQTLDQLSNDLLPKQTALTKAYPNPFNPTTTINYNLAEAGLVNLEVYNVLGQKVATLVNTTMQKGAYQVAWNASSFATGVYLFRLQLNGKAASIKKVTLIK